MLNYPIKLQTTHPTWQWRGVYLLQEDHLAYYEDGARFSAQPLVKVAEGLWASDYRKDGEIVRFQEVPTSTQPKSLRTAAQVFAEAAAPDASLEARKNGKVRMDLVVEGYPHLHWELGRMMTWAGIEKGYLPHDWKKYPQEVFLAAAERHRNKRLRGEVVDDESGLPHLIHEAFNAMAAAEVYLIAQGKGDVSENIQG